MSVISSSADEALYYKELKQLIDLWIETLPPKRKEIFILHYRDNLSTSSIAEKLQLSQKTVQNQLGIIFKDLRGNLPDLAIFLLLCRV